MDYKYTQFELNYALESAYPGARTNATFWVGQPLNEAGEISGPPMLIDWLEDKIGAPAPDDLDAIVASHPMPPVVPASVTKAQGKVALINANLYDPVLAYIDAITDPTDKLRAQIAFDGTNDWRRDSPFLNAAAAALGVTAEQMDNLFIQAAEIQL